MSAGNETRDRMIAEGRYRPRYPDSRFIHVADLVGPDGQTYRERNGAIPHAIPVGALVELEDGSRLFVTAHRRDCDMSPPYSLGRPGERWEDHGHGEEGLTVIRET